MPEQIFIDRWGTEHKKPENTPVVARNSVYGIALKDGKVLLIKSPEFPDWELPGGAVEKGETEDEAVKREFFEETGFKVTRVGQKIWQQKESFYHPETYYDSTVNYFLIEIDDSKQHKEQIFESEMEKLAWFVLKEIDLGEINPSNRDVLDRLIKENK